MGRGAINVAGLGVGWLPCRNVFGGVLPRRIFFLSFVLSASSIFAADPAVLAKVLGATEVSYPARLEAVKSLSKSLSSEEITSLYAFLGRKAADDPSRPGELDAIKNDVVNQLKAQDRFPQELPGHLMSMYTDRSHGNVWRDYCIQHLGDSVLEIRDETGREKAIRVLWSAVDERQGSIPGTGLIALFNLCGQGDVDRARVATKALSMVRSPEYGEPAKITALQICACLGEVGVLPDARKLVADGPIPVRTSAIACLGVLGDQSDLVLLQMAAVSTDIRLKTAARAAIKKINAKIMQP